MLVAFPEFAPAMDAGLGIHWTGGVLGRYHLTNMSATVILLLC